jgi:hypothetical protein
LAGFPAAGGEVSRASWTQTGEVPVVLPASVLFAGDQAVLLPGAGPTLDKVVTLLKETYPTATAGWPWRGVSPRRRAAARPPPTGSFP